MRDARRASLHQSHAELGRISTDDDCEYSAVGDRAEGIGTMRQRGRSSRQPQQSGIRDQTRARGAYRTQGQVADAEETSSSVIRGGTRGGRGSGGRGGIQRGRGNPGRGRFSAFSGPNQSQPVGFSASPSPTDGSTEDYGPRRRPAPRKLKNGRGDAQTIVAPREEFRASYQKTEQQYPTTGNPVCLLHEMIRVAVQTWEDPQSVPECPICCQPMPYVAVGKCQDCVCWVCAAKMRMLQKNRVCAFCKMTLDVVVFMKAPVSAGSRPAKLPSEDERSLQRLGSQSFGSGKKGGVSLSALQAALHTTGLSLNPGDYPPEFYDKANGHLFSSTVVRQLVEALTTPICWYPECTKDLGAGCLVFKSQRAWRDHIEAQHRANACTVCLNHRKVFLAEQFLFSRGDLPRHFRQGDRRGEMMVSPHVSCTACHAKLLDLEAYLAHVKEHHVSCYICDRAADQSPPKPPVAFASFDDLSRHYYTSHYPCPQCEYVAFATHTELLLHAAQQHSGGRPHGGQTARNAGTATATLQERLVQTSHRLPQSRQGSSLSSTPRTLVRANGRATLPLAPPGLSTQASPDIAATPVRPALTTRETIGSGAATRAQGRAAARPGGAYWELVRDIAKAEQFRRVRDILVEERFQAAERTALGNSSTDSADQTLLRTAFSDFWTFGVARPSGFRPGRGKGTVDSNPGTLLTQWLSDLQDSATISPAVIAKIFNALWDKEDSAWSLLSKRDADFSEEEVQEPKEWSRWRRFFPFLSPATELWYRLVQGSHNVERVLLAMEGTSMMGDSHTNGNPLGSPSVEAKVSAEGVVEDTCSGEGSSALPALATSALPIGPNIPFLRALQEALAVYIATNKRAVLREAVSSVGSASKVEGRSGTAAFPSGSTASGSNAPYGVRQPTVRSMRSTLTLPCWAQTAQSREEVTHKKGDLLNRNQGASQGASSSGFVLPAPVIKRLTTASRSVLAVLTHFLEDSQGFVASRSAEKILSLRGTYYLLSKQDPSVSTTSRDWGLRCHRVFQLLTPGEIQFLLAYVECSVALLPQAALEEEFPQLAASEGHVSFQHSLNTRLRDGHVGLIRGRRTFGGAFFPASCASEPRASATVTPTPRQDHTTQAGSSASTAQQRSQYSSAAGAQIRMTRNVLGSERHFPALDDALDVVSPLPSRSAGSKRADRVVQHPSGAVTTRATFSSTLRPQPAADSRIAEGRRDANASQPLSCSSLGNEADFPLALAPAPLASVSWSPISRDTVNSARCPRNFTTALETSGVAFPPMSSSSSPPAPSWCRGSGSSDVTNGPNQRREPARVATSTSASGSPADLEPPEVSAASQWPSLPETPGTISLGNSRWQSNSSATENRLPALTCAICRTSNPQGYRRCRLCSSILRPRTNRADPIPRRSGTVNVVMPASRRN